MATFLLWPCQQTAMLLLQGNGLREASSTLGSPLLRPCLCRQCPAPGIILLHQQGSSKGYTALVAHIASGDIDSRIPYTERTTIRSSVAALTRALKLLV